VNGGIDVVFTSINYTLGANVENGQATAAGITINGNELNNELYGYDGGGETLNGGKGADVLYGLDGADILNGGTGRDVLEGGLGVDKMTGGSGSDVFRYRLDNPSDLNSIGGDLIADFEVGKDKIDLYDVFSDFNVYESDVIGEGYLRLLVNGNDTLVQFDKDGGADGFVTLAVLQNVTNATLADLIYPQTSGVE
jgi:Ca2+-binding RTX toxin-like protein